MLLDFDQYSLVPEAKHYALNEDDDGSAFNTEYFERVIYKLADSKVIKCVAWYILTFNV